MQATITLTTKRINQTATELSIEVDLAENDYMYKDYINFSVDHPAITLSSWKSSLDPVNHYDTTFKETKKIFNQKVIFTLIAHTADRTVPDAHLHFSYYTHAKNHLDELLFPLCLNNTPSLSPDPSIPLTQAIDAQQSTVQTVPSNKPIPQPIIPASPISPLKKQLQSYSASLASLIEQADSLWTRILLVLLLGMLLSLTPCIYPMIPITIGVLQSRGTRSIGRNFLLSISYVLGIATTFALFGLLAAFTGQLFGSLLNNPFVILFIVAVLIYLALSLLGFYTMRLPSSFSTHNAEPKNRSLLSVFLFGAATGTVASPCLSPGLILLLSMVTKMGSAFWGFILLFFFGVGLGLPLIVVGTFAGSLNRLPRAGLWMVDIKRLFGFILLGMCLYFLRPIISCGTLYCLAALLCIVTGIFYIYDSNKTASHIWRSIKTMLGIALFAGSFILAFYSYKAFHTASCPLNFSIWETDYEAALERAQQEHKKLFIDVTSKICGICQVIEKTVFKDPAIRAELEKCVALKLEGSHTTNKRFALLREKYDIIGFPTYLLIDPATDTLLARWSYELDSKPREEFAAELQRLIDQK